MSTRSAFLFSIWLEFTFVYAVSVSFLYMVRVDIVSTRSAFTFLYMVRVSIYLHGHSLCLVDSYCDFKFNVPSASHLGGVWERQIRTVGSVLVPMLEKSGSQLLSEVMCIVNCRTLSVNDLYDSSLAEPLTHNHFLTMQTKIVLPPPGEFQQADVYSRKKMAKSSIYVECVLVQMEK